MKTAIICNKFKSKFRPETKKNIISLHIKTANNMLVPIAEVSKEFKKDVRTIQLWCAKEGIAKVGNEYQISQEQVDLWRLTRMGAKAKPKFKPITTADAKKVIPENSPKFRAISISVLSIIFTALVGFIIYYNVINSQQETTIREQKQTIQVQQTTIEQKQNQLDQKQSTIEQLKRQHSIDSTLINTTTYKRKTAY